MLCALWGGKMLLLFMWRVARAGDGLKLTPKTPLRERCEEENDDGWHNTHIYPRVAREMVGSWGRDRKFVFFFVHLFIFPPPLSC